MDFVGLVPLEHAHAQGIYHAIGKAIDNSKLNIDTFKNKLVDFTADRASVILGSKAGVQALLKEKVKHIIDFWHMPHCLELCSNNEVRSEKASLAIDMLLLIYTTNH